MLHSHTKEGKVLLIYPQRLVLISFQSQLNFFKLILQYCNRKEKQTFIVKFSNVPWCHTAAVIKSFSFTGSNNRCVFHFSCENAYSCIGSDAFQFKFSTRDQRMGFLLKITLKPKGQVVLRCRPFRVFPAPSSPSPAPLLPPLPSRLSSLGPSEPHCWSPQ